MSNGIWVLVLMYGITGWGAAGVRYVEFPDEASCYKALKEMRIEATSQKSGDDDEQVVAYCAPKQ